MFKILEKRELTDNIYLLRIEAPRVAQSALPGQFVIVRVDEQGERVPLTIADFDKEQGSVTIVIQAIGVSTRKLCTMNEGDSIADFAGPLGNPSEFVNMSAEELAKRHFLFVAGGVGTAPVYPQVKWLHEHGGHADVIIGAKTASMLIYTEEMEKVYSDTAEYVKGLNKLHIRDWLFIRNPKWPAAVLRGLGLIVLLPLVILSLIPTGLLFLIPKIFIKKLIKDRMFHSSFYVGVSVFVSVPLCLILPIVLLWIFANFWWALGYLVAFPFMFVLVWNYMRLFLKFKATCIFIKRSNRDVVNKLRELRKSIFERLDKLVK